VTPPARALLEGDIFTAGILLGCAGPFNVLWRMREIDAQDAAAQHELIFQTAVAVLTLVVAV
jgi:hypothetical protein